MGLYQELQLATWIKLASYIFSTALYAVNDSTILKLANFFSSWQSHSAFEMSLDVRIPM